MIATYNKRTRLSCRVSTYINDKLLIQADSASGFKRGEGFTLFWLGIADNERIQRFIRDVVQDMDNRCRSIYLFRQAKEITPPLPLRKNGLIVLPNPAVSSFFAEHGDPNFLRYELFRKYKKKPRLILWSCQTKGADAGIYAGMDFYEDKRVMNLVTDLIRNTLLEKHENKTILSAIKRTLHNVLFYEAKLIK
ncbi:MAG: hypothetical protein V1867_08020 [Candidatus Falkowbacteria bacterium]